MNEFTLPMKKREKIAGWIYLPIHIVLMSLIILPVIVVVCLRQGVVLTTVQMNAIYYCIGFAYVLIFMWSFLRESFVMKQKHNPFATTGIALAAYFAMNLVANVTILYFATQNLTNPNSQAVNEAINVDLRSMFAVSVIMAPIVEEVLFRGVVFGTIRTKNRILAYVVSVLLFAVYHLWSSVVLYQDWTILVYLIQYIPPGLVLAWSYERSGSIWSSIMLHMIINSLVVISVAG